jgi:signal transduction histidine kinase/HPt (histidine-containing phosphotransfer) domain-containing protein/ActR/RegA family two-component response regulator
MKSAFRAIESVITPHALLALFISASLAVLFSFGYSRWEAASVRETCEASIRRHMMEAAKRLSTLATAEELDTYREPADMELPGYKALRQKLVEFAEDAGVKYAYYLRVVGGDVRYIIDNDFDEATRVGLDSEPEKFSDYADLGMEDALGGSTAASSYGAYAPKWGNLAAAYAPVFDGDGKVAAVCGVDIADDPMLGMRKHERYSLVLGLAATVLVSLSGVYGFTKFRREAAAAQNASIAKSRFLSRMSHEIRTPMNAVMGMSDMALMEYGKPKGVEHIADIKRAGALLLDLINGILDFSALESGKLLIRADRYRTVSVLNDTLSLIRARLKDKPGVELALDIDPEIPSVLVGDETRVKEVLLNLLTNATKYTPGGFIRFAARGRREAGDGVLLTFEVSDSGMGIRQEDMDTLFTDFSRVESKHTSGVQGTGIGLSLCRALCRAMGGDVVAVSQYGVGSTFTATVRQGAADEVHVGDFAEDRAYSSETPWVADFAAPGFRVLIVDDSATNIKVAKGFLASYHVKADACLSGQEAIELVRQNKYDLVLMDHMMPEMDGIEAVAAIRALGGSCQRLPVAALTANAIAGMRDQFLRSGFDDYLSKPIEMPKLGDLLGRWVPAQKRMALPGRRALLEKLWGNRSGIEGLDTAKGIANAGGMLEPYREVLDVFCLDARDRMGGLSADRASSDPKGFVINVHALKSAAASVGAMGISKTAADLEAAGQRGDMAYIMESIAGFRDALLGIVEKIERALADDPIPDTGCGPTGGKDRPEGRQPAHADAAAERALGMLKEALEREDVGRVDRLLEELSASDPGDETRDLLTRVSDLTLTSEFLDAAKTVGAFLGRLGADDMESE